MWDPHARRRTPCPLSIRVVPSLCALAAAATFIILLVIVPSRARASNLLYPDLRALPPSELRFDRVKIDGVDHAVLRFTAVEWNAGQGPVDLRPAYVSADGKTIVAQRIFDASGGYVEHEVGRFIFHPTHNHWHFEQFADYEVWPREEYEARLASGRRVGEPRWRGSKTTGQGESVCLRDSYLVQKLPAAPRKKVYDECGITTQGISVGWGDEYDYKLPDQWVDFGEALPPDGEYVIRIVADPNNLIHESPDKGDWARERPEDNEAVTYFTHAGGTVTLR
jgi:hypothetical protein